MILKHVALVCSSEERSDKFYEHVLGLKKTSSKVLPATLAKQIFDIDAECQFIHYMNDNLHFEIFITAHQTASVGKFEHVCLEVPDLEVFLDTCCAMDVSILQIPRGESNLIFIKDYDGNLFEIKQQP